MTIFFKIDIRYGYHQLRVWAEDIMKIDFKTHYGHYEFLWMSLSLANSPSAFMDFDKLSVLTLFDSFVIVLIDDIFMYSRSREKHV